MLHIRRYGDPAVTIASAAASAASAADDTQDKRAGKVRRQRSKFFSVFLGSKMSSKDKDKDKVKINISFQLYQLITYISY